MVGHLVEDLIFEGINPARFQAELVGRKETPEYKQEGYFVFSDLRDGKYKVKITGERLQPTTLDVEIPIPLPAPNKPPLLDSQGDDELMVIALTIAPVVGNGGVKVITFEPVILTKEIRAGARVISKSMQVGATAELAADLQPGYIKMARVKNADDIAAGDIVRIVRDKSIRMNFDPYYLFDSPITRVVGKVVSKTSGVPLAGAQIELTHINDAEVEPNDVLEAKIYTGLDVNNNKVVLGAKKDILTATNEKGDYNLYFSNETLASYKITAETLQKLENDNVPKEVRDLLASLNRNYRGYERFLAALKESLRRDDLIKYQSKIIEYSENFIRKLTLKATLDGFKPVSAPINSIHTAERKVLDFPLERT